MSSLTYEVRTHIFAKYSGPGHVSVTFNTVPTTFFGEITIYAFFQTCLHIFYM